jgi:hypothetical protein
MRGNYRIPKGNWINDEPITLRVDNIDKASTDHYQLTIEWGDVDKGVGEGFVNGSRVATIHKDGEWWYAVGDTRTKRESKETPFHALAWLAYTEGVGW